MLKVWMPPGTKPAALVLRPLELSPSLPVMSQSLSSWSLALLKLGDWVLLPVFLTSTFLSQHIITSCQSFWNIMLILEIALQLKLVKVSPFLLLLPRK